MDIVKYKLSFQSIINPVKYSDLGMTYAENKSSDELNTFHTEHKGWCADMSLVMKRKELN